MIDHSFLLLVEVCISVGDKSRRFFAQGLGFDGYGDYLEEFDGFGGEVVVISSEGRVFRRIDVSVMHMSRRGWGFSVECEDLPEAPFLMAGDLDSDLELVYDDVVLIDPSERQSMLFSECYPGFLFPVSGDGWIGRFEIGDTLGKGRMLVFSRHLAWQGKGAEVMFAGEGLLAGVVLWSVEDSVAE